MRKGDRRGGRRDVAALGTHVEVLEPRVVLSAAQLVKEINAFAFTSAPAHFVSMDRTTYFTTDDGVRGTELWRTDGTAGGTHLVKDIEPGAASSSPTCLTNVGGTLFFIAQTSLGGTELWKSDGTTVGTVQVADHAADSGVSTASGLAAAGGDVLFAPIVPGVEPGFQAWSSDGTTAGTQALAGAKRWSTLQLNKALTVGNWTYVGGQGNGAELWRTDGTAAGSGLTFVNLAGDANRDGQVNFDDLLILSKSYNATGATFAQADLNGDGVV